MSLASEILAYLRDNGPASSTHLVRQMNRVHGADSCDTLDTLVELLDAGEIEQDLFGDWKAARAAA